MNKIIIIVSWVLSSLLLNVSLAQAVDYTFIDSAKVKLSKEFHVSVKELNQNLSLVESQKGISSGPINVIKQYFAAFLTEDFDKMVALSARHNRELLIARKNSNELGSTYWQFKTMLSAANITIHTKYTFLEENMLFYRLGLSDLPVFKGTFFLNVGLAFEDGAWKIEDGVNEGIDALLRDKYPLLEQSYTVSKFNNAIEYSRDYQ